jgi:hypothetical protein
MTGGWKNANGVTGTAPVASTYRDFDLKKLAEGVAAIPVPGEESNHQNHADSARASYDLPVG